MAGVVVKLTPANLEIDPGGEATLTVEVTNRTSVVEGFEIAVVGPLARWARVDPPVLNLDAGVDPGPGYESTDPTDREAAATGTTQITFRIPRAPDPLAQTYDFGVHVRAVSDATVARVEEGDITVAPFVELETEIVPETSRGSFSGNHELSIRNHGNIVADVAVRAVQVNRELTFGVVPAHVGIPPGKPKAVRIRAKPKDRFLLGPPRQVPFQVKIDEPLAGALTIAGFLEQRPIIPSWVKPLAGLALAGVAAVVLLPPVLMALDLIPGPSPTASAFESIAPPSPTPPPPTQGLTPPPTDTRTPTPVQGDPSRLRVTGDTAWNEELEIEFVCTEQNELDCRDRAIGRLDVLLDSLLGSDPGGPLVEFETDQTGTLVVFARWEEPFTSFRAGVIQGKARRIAIDLAPLLADGSAYVLIEDEGRNRSSFLVPEGHASELLKIFYLVPEWMPTPAPDPTAGATPRLDGLLVRTPLQAIPLSSISFGG
jgi:hypothetical protein